MSRDLSHDHSHLRCINQQPLMLLSHLSGPQVGIISYTVLQSTGTTMSVGLVMHPQQPWSANNYTYENLARVILATVLCTSQPIQLFIYAEVLGNAMLSHFQLVTLIVI